MPLFTLSCFATTIILNYTPPLKTQKDWEEREFDEWWEKRITQGCKAGSGE